MIAVFCGVTNCPLTSILLAYELFAGVGMAPMTLTIGRRLHALRLLRTVP